MADKVLVAFDTIYGSTRDVAEAVAKTLREGGASVDIKPVKEARSLAGSAPASDARDWGAIEAWAAGLPARFERSA